MTAVLYYLQAEEEASMNVLPESRTVPPPPQDFWSYSGRQSQMTLRSMLQMRLFPGWKG